MRWTQRWSRRPVCHVRGEFGEESRRIAVLGWRGGRYCTHSFIGSVLVAMSQRLLYLGYVGGFKDSRNRRDAVGFRSELEN